MPYQLTSPPLVLGGRTKADYAGKSTDEKPTGDGLELPLATGSSCYEIDTGEAFMWDADDKVWIMQ